MRITLYCFASVQLSQAINSGDYVVCKSMLFPEHWFSVFAFFIMADMRDTDNDFIVAPLKNKVHHSTLTKFDSVNILRSSFIFVHSFCSWRSDKAQILLKWEEHILLSLNSFQLDTGSFHLNRPILYGFLHKVTDC